jgi:hypothetical protein
MQQATGTKRFVASHIGLVALTVGIVAGILTGVAALAATNSLSWPGSEPSSIAQPSSAATRNVDRADALRQLRGDTAPVSHGAELAGLHRADAIALARGGGNTPMLDTTTEWTEWTRRTHRYWTPERQSRLAAGN